MSTESLLEIPSLAVELAPADLLAQRPSPITQLGVCWDGQPTPAELTTQVWLGWTPQALYAYFECRYDELNLSVTPKFTEKTIGLWERDVVEIFLAPDAQRPTHYREIEVSPLGEWLDLELIYESEPRQLNWDWNSELTAACEIDTVENIWRAACRMPAVNLFGALLQAEQECRGNLYRCAGTEPQRQYLTWHPTLTPQPNFHVPQRFGRFRFRG